jgi:hypothetical protein
MSRAGRLLEQLDWKHVCQTCEQPLFGGEIKEGICLPCADRSVFERSLDAQAKKTAHHVKHAGKDLEKKLSHPYNAQAIYKDDGHDPERHRVVTAMNHVADKHHHVRKYLDKHAGSDSDFDKTVDSYRGKSDHDIHHDLKARAKEEKHND